MSLKDDTRVRGGSLTLGISDTSCPTGSSDSSRLPSPKPSGRDDGCEDEAKPMMVKESHLGDLALVDPSMTY